MSIRDCSIVRWSRHARSCHALAAIPLLSLFLITRCVACADAEPDAIAAVVAKVSPAVVRVVSVRPPKQSEDKPGAKIAAEAATDRINTNFGSGFIIDPAGYIATNKHVIDGATSVFVVTADGVRYRTTVVGALGKSDLALLHIDAEHQLPFVPFGDSDKMRVGDGVFAIGSPFGFDTSVTAGIISAVNRDIMESPFDEYLQTDAAINHGNSGGPLFNLSGEVIGMNSVIFAPTPGSAGVGFAVPSNVLQFVFGRLMKTGALKAGMLPIHTQQVSWMLKEALGAPDVEGALVTSVQIEGETTPLGTIRPGDVVRTFNGQKVLEPRDLARKVANAPIGSDAVLEIYRSGVLESTHVTIQAWPEAPPIVLSNDRQRTLGLELVSGHGENGKPIVTVASVDPAGTGAESGIQKDDIIVEVQQTTVSQPDQALRIFRAQSSMKHLFTAVLVERKKQLSWLPLEVSD
jgi:S1-C subfamily serine protease